MKTWTKLTEPELFVDDHAGIYLGQTAFNQLAPRYKNQAIKQMSKDDIESISEGPDNEFYYDACDSFTQVVFKSPTGQKMNIQYAEGGLWLIPFCFLRTKQASEFFGS